VGGAVLYVLLSDKKGEKGIGGLKVVKSVHVGGKIWKEMRRKVTSSGKGRSKLQSGGNVRKVL